MASQEIGSGGITGDRIWWDRVEDVFSVGGGIGIFLCGADQASADGIHSNVLAVVHSVGFIADTMIREACLPDREFGMQAKGKSSLDELDGALKRNLIRGGDECVEVVRHDDEVMQQIFGLIAIGKEGFEE